MTNDLSHLPDTVLADAWHHANQRISEVAQRRAAGMLNDDDVLLEAEASAIFDVVEAELERRV